MLESFLELETVAVHELSESQPGDLALIGEPAGLNQASNLLGELIWDFDFHRFHIDLLTVQS